MFTIPELPYELDALEPFISAKTMDFHYHKHHQTYINNLNNLIADTQFAPMSLEDIIKQTYGSDEYKAIFNNAAQAWNHTFFWNSMSPAGGKITDSEIEDHIIRDFGSFEKFRADFKREALEQFGSGWIWLVKNKQGILEIIKTSNADTPIVHSLKPLITCDVWEHAYYLDYQNRRADFVEAFLDHLMVINNLKQL